jgi:hypothetical protein
MGQPEASGQHRGAGFLGRRASRRLKFDKVNLNNDLVAQTPGSVPGLHPKEKRGAGENLRLGRPKPCREKKIRRRERSEERAAGREAVDADMDPEEGGVQAVEFPGASREANPDRVGDRRAPHCGHGSLDDEGDPEFVDPLGLATDVKKERGGEERRRELEREVSEGEPPEGVHRPAPGRAASGRSRGTGRGTINPRRSARRGSPHCSRWEPCG